MPHAQTSRAGMLIIAGLVIGSALAAAPAFACIAEAPPAWAMLQREGGPVIVIGRVAGVTRAEAPRRTDHFEIWDDTARITPVETIQGAADEAYEITGVGELRVLQPGQIFCADRMTLRPGDLVLGYERPDGSLRVVEPHQIPDALRLRLEALR